MTLELLVRSQGDIHPDLEASRDLFIKAVGYVGRAVMSHENNNYVLVRSFDDKDPLKNVSVRIETKDGADSSFEVKYVANPEDKPEGRYLILSPQKNGPPIYIKVDN